MTSTSYRKIYHVAVASSVTLPLRRMANDRCNVEEARVIGKTAGVLESETRFEERIHPAKIWTSHISFTHLATGN